MGRVLYGVAMAGAFVAGLSVGYLIGPHLDAFVVGGRR